MAVREALAIPPGNNHGYGGLRISQVKGVGDTRQFDRRVTIVETIFEQYAECDSRDKLERVWRGLFKVYIKPNNTR